MSKKPGWKPYVAASVQIVTLNTRGGETISAAICLRVYPSGDVIDAVIFPGSSATIAIEHEDAAKSKNRTGVGFSLRQYWRRPRHD
jgi:hypothetical protein